MKARSRICRRGFVKNLDKEELQARTRILKERTCRYWALQFAFECTYP